MIHVEGLSRSYGDFLAVSDVSFDIGKGEIVGLLGHNGAGKTTIMKMLTGYMEPDAGCIMIGGKDIADDRRAVQDMIGYLPENAPVYPEMTVVEYLAYVAELRGFRGVELEQAVRRGIADTDLGEKASAPIDTLSRGYRQRVGVAQAILHRPAAIILDEPTNGLDPSQIQHMRDLIRTLAEDATVILSTHILQEVQAVCDRVIIVNAGQKALDARLADLEAASRLLVSVDAAPEAGTAILQGVADVIDTTYLGARDGTHRYAVTVNGAGIHGTAPKLARTVVENGLQLFAMETETKSIETIFAEISASDSSKHATVTEVGHA